MSKPLDEALKAVANMPDSGLPNGIVELADRRLENENAILRNALAKTLRWPMHSPTLDEYNYVKTLVEGG